MLQMFRNFFKSKIGVGVTLAFLALIAVAFASSDVANTSLFGGVSGGDRVAVVGDARIDAAELDASVRNALQQVQQTNPTLTMQAFLAQGGLQDVLNQLLQRTALAEFARQHGMRAGDTLIDRQILQNFNFRGPDGSFDEAAFRTALAQQGVTEAVLREDLANGILVRQLIAPITYSPIAPLSFGQRYAELKRETRRGALAMLPSSAFAPQGNPTNAQLQTFYNANRGRYIRPERRVIRFAQFGIEALGTLPAPTDAQIAQRFQRDRAQYAATERRRFTQLVVPTQDAAQAIVTEVRGGKSLEAAAREKGLATSSVGPATRAELTAQTSAAVAQAAFGAAQGALAQPVRGGLGWYVLRVEEIDRQPARTLAQVRGEIATALAEEQRRAALDDLTARIEDEFSDGRSLSEIARELKLTLTSTRPATADGRIYGAAGETVPPVLGRVLETAFQMDETEPQLAELVAGETFVIFDVSEIVPSATAPLGEIRTDVVADWRREQGAKAAKAAADRIVQRLGRRMSLADAIAAERKPEIKIEPIDLSREEVDRVGRVPPTLALFFSMAEGTVKRLEAGNDAGWYVVQLREIETGKVELNDPAVLETLRELGSVVGEEYLLQFVNAVEREVGTERNESAIKAVEAQLTGQQAN